jgi:hypothetical protein
VEGHAYLPIGRVYEFHQSPMFSTAKKSVELVKPIFNVEMTLDRLSELPVVGG